MNNPSIHPSQRDRVIIKTTRQNHQWILTHNYQLIYLYFKQYLLHISSTVRYIHKVNGHRAYLPTPSSQVLQCPGGPLQRVWVWALRQEGEVGLYYRRMPQHLNPFWGLSSIWQRSHTIPLQKQRCDMKNKSVRQENTQNLSPSASKSLERGIHTDTNLQWQSNLIYFQWATVRKVWFDENVQLFKCQCEVSENNVIRQRSYCDFTLQYALYTPMFKSLGMSGNAF